MRSRKGSRRAGGSRKENRSMGRSRKGSRRTGGSRKGS